MNIRKWFVAANARLAAAYIQSAHLDTELLLVFVLKKTREYIITHPDEVLNTFQVKRLSKLLKRRLNREPIAYILGVKEFYGREFEVTPDVLIPRPESETIIELFKKHQLSGRVLDVGTGSGCIGLSLKAENPEISITLCDISQRALVVAKKNAKKLDIKPVRYVVSDLLDHWLSHKKPNKFEVLVANLPYVDEGWLTSPETKYEPQQALYSSDGGLEHIKKLIDQSVGLLRKNGHLLLEADPRQHEQITKYTKTKNYQLVEKKAFILLYKHLV